jgi:hypothetical protein
MSISAPASVLTGTTFTVQVIITTNGTTVAKTDPCVSKAPVTLDVYEGETYLETLQATASAGIATFGLTFPDDATYNLYARATNGDAFAAAAAATGCNSYYNLSAQKSITAVAIPATQPIAPCPDNTSCLQTFGGTGSAATLIADFGSFTATWGTYDSSFVTGCNATPVDTGSGVLDFGYTPDQSLGASPKTIIFALQASLVTKGIGLFNLCWGASATFPVLGGGTAQLQSDGLYWGVLPACGKNATGPCVLFKKSNQHNVAFLGVLAPNNGAGDPKGAFI